MTIERIRKAIIALPNPLPPPGPVLMAAQTQLPAALERVLPDGRNVYEISPAFGRVLAALVLVHGRRRVLEFGAGASSVMLATALAPFNGTLTSVEQDPAWCRERWAQVEATGADAHLVGAPVRFSISVRGVCYAQPTARPALEDRAPFDLLIVDAPGGLRGRTGTLHLAAPYLAEGALILADDIGRPLIGGMLGAWLRTYPGLELLECDPGFAGRGVALLRWHRGRACFSPRAWLTSAYEAVSLRRRRAELRRSQNYGPAASDLAIREGIRRP